MPRTTLHCGCTARLARIWLRGHADGFLAEGCQASRSRPRRPAGHRLWSNRLLSAGSTKRIATRRRGNRVEADRTVMAGKWKGVVTSDRTTYSPGIAVGRRHRSPV